jgi:hypothetical protein
MRVRAGSIGKGRDGRVLDRRNGRSVGSVLRAVIILRFGEY